MKLVDNNEIYNKDFNTKDVGKNIVRFGEYPFSIEITYQRIGFDLLVTIAGGTKHHIGAVAIAEYHPSMSDSTKPSASTSVVVITPHKEGEIVYEVANQLAREFRTNVIITGGIHVDNASSEDIQLLVDNMYKAIEIVKSRLHCTKNT
ncbi:hypothetical protein [Desulfuribacillus alkaliarsenatis]|uniref:Prenylated flavin chaperone LpdD-like domain-containing protein n=1 Tax=Desulfuribacillus alkaliarsenatis TaxID=766136 RepID=A0A1E5G0U6_9FIRM|nr:hypothetical protein [Desulfuribacillus alkaliarsenatis]OEF96491.1 hypothetical protein BHF68_07490 [Desulfuribacillus alkaliarsenatis]